MMRVRLSLALALIAVVAVAGCTTPSVSATLGPGATGSAAPTAPEASPSLAIDLTGLDACSLLDEGAVRALTGWPADVGITSDASGPNPVKCFWGATQAGVPGYVEIAIGRTTGLPPHADCSIVPVTDIGTEAQMATCPGDNVFAEAFEGGVLFSLQVQSKTPGDLASVLTSVLEAVTSR